MTDLDTMLAATVRRRIEIVYVPKGGALLDGVWIARSLAPEHDKSGIASEQDGPRKALDNLLRAMGDTGESVLDEADLRYSEHRSGIRDWAIVVRHQPSGLIEERNSDAGWKSMLQAKADAVTSLENQVKRWLSAG